ncbi:sugar ABC transporter permease [Gracilibacillus boraciitolerans JCM 21714]|uniref:Sugar ABC transporter permease n=1 Tax=Gracilibacillus boraciitolerans JCM 21714 TaxID=1298598 RepID=W4VQT3_9BACI|nr:sugar ABC transporter permease [Gracilibacillus boraciitolerans JCM 21714]
MIWGGYVYNPQMGILNALLDFLGLESLKMQWLSDPDIAMYFVAIPIIWNFIGLYLVIFIASLQNISSELDDALQLDGANFFQALFYIKLPLIWNTIKVAIVLCISGSLKTFDLVIVMTGGGGPANATEIMASYMYNSTFEVYRFGYGSALSAMILIISLLFIVISQLLMKRKTA